MNHLWEFYVEVASTRGGSGFGLNPLNITDILAWEQGLELRPLHPWERLLLIRIDQVFLKHENEKTKKRGDKKARTTASKSGVRSVMAAFGAKKAPSKAKAAAK